MNNKIHLCKNLCFTFHLERVRNLKRTIYAEVYFEIPSSSIQYKKYFGTRFFIILILFRLKSKYIIKSWNFISFLGSSNRTYYNRRQISTIFHYTFLKRCRVFDRIPIDSLRTDIIVQHRNVITFREENFYLLLCEL